MTSMNYNHCLVCLSTINFMCRWSHIRVIQVNQSGVHTQSVHTHTWCFMHNEKFPFPPTEFFLMVAMATRSDTHVEFVYIFTNWTKIVNDVVKWVFIRLLTCHMVQRLLNTHIGWVHCSTRSDLLNKTALHCTKCVRCTVHVTVTPFHYTSINWLDYTSLVFFQSTVFFLCPLLLLSSSFFFVPLQSGTIFVSICTNIL